MYNIFERVIPYLYAIFSCVIVSCCWTLYVNRDINKLIFTRAKSSRKFRGKGTEVIRTTGEVRLDYYNNNVHLIFYDGERFVLLDMIPNFGKYVQDQKNEAKVLYRDGLPKVICFDVGVMNDAVHRSFMLQARYVFLTVIGAYVIWSMLLKM